MRKTIVRSLQESRISSPFAGSYSLLKSLGYISQCGWLESYRRRLPVEKDGRPLPWYTYAAINFLEGRLQRDMSVFEFGSGYSTLWWAGRVATVVSCEHDTSWYSRMKEQLPANVEYRYHNRGLGGNYIKAASHSDSTFDIVLIDGRDRVECVKHSLGALKPGGVIVWDNSDRDRYKPGFEFLAERDFRRLDFYGLGPISARGKSTSVFYQSKNCLGI